MSTTPATSRFLALCESVNLVFPAAPDDLVVKAHRTNGPAWGCNYTAAFPFNTIGTVKTKTCEQDEWRKQSVGLRIGLEYRGRSYFFDYWLGVAHFEIIPSRFPGFTTIRMKKDAITAASVLANLLQDQSYADSTFEEFCSELGYDNDRISSKHIFRDVRRQARKVAVLLGDDLDEFVSAFQDQSDY